MQIDNTVFKAYDIRGIYPTQLDEKLAYAIGRSYSIWLRTQDKDAHTVVVGGDMRLSTPSLKAELIKGLLDGGLNVDDIGLVSTPTFYFTVGKFGYSGGLQVSASHNPKDYNGVKVVGKNSNPVGKNNGLFVIRDTIINDQLGEKAEVQGILKSGDQVPKALEEATKFYLELSDIDLEKLKEHNFKIVHDAANAMGALDFGTGGVYGSIPVTPVYMNFELDGTFPSHEADPIKDENTKDLRERVIAEGAHLGIATDGDADRIFFVDEKGNSVPQSIIRGILGQIELEKNPGAKICYDIRPGKITKDMIENAGGIAVVTSVGHTFVKNKMDEVGAIFGGESSGHFFYKLPFGTFEASQLVALKILAWLSKENKPFSELIAPYNKYVHSGEINSHVPSQEVVQEKIQKVREIYKDNITSELDGVYVEFPDAWFLVRGSNTEPLLRLSIEANNQEALDKVKNEVLAIIS